MRLVDVLKLWADWMQRDNPRLGYPKKSLLAPNATGWRFATSEERDQEYDKIIVVAVDASVNSLAIPERDAIYRQYLNAPVVARFRQTFEQRLETAQEQLLLLLERRNINIDRERSSIVSEQAAAMPPETLPEPKLEARIVAMKAQGRSYQEIADTLKISKTWAYKIVRLHTEKVQGLPVRAIASLYSISVGSAYKLKNRSKVFMV